MAFPGDPLPPRQSARHRLCSAALAAGILLGLPALAVLTPATTIRRMTLPQVVEASETILEGRVDSVRSYWEGSQILTEVRLTVGRSFKGIGAPGSRVSFVQLGGRVTSPVPLDMVVPGAPVHQVGDQGFYFLQGGAPGQRVIVGLSRGHVPVRRDAQGPFVTFDGVRRTPGEFADAIRAALAGQAAPRARDDQ